MFVEFYLSYVCIHFLHSIMIEGNVERSIIRNETSPYFIAEAFQNTLTNHNKVLKALGFLKHLQRKECESNFFSY